MRLERRRLRRDLGAGAVLGLVSVPDGLATGLLAGLNPLAGLYGYLAGTAAGALATSSAVMAVQGTGAMAVIIADVPALHGHDSSGALVTLGVLTGAVMVAAGLLRLGTLVRFVPNAVLTGFVNAVAVTIVLAQLADVTGYRSSHGNRLVRLVDTALHLPRWQPQVLVVAAGTLGLILVLERTRLGPLGLVLSVVLASTAAWGLGLREVRRGGARADAVGAHRRAGRTRTLERVRGVASGR